ncbi:hypothetical protein SAMN02745945_01983 [Peptoclostridium litorale DSM 5388]|uniref:Nucleotidase n=1 Tax=Peptoclostridium litorale DSM 5388 TaxID=1121324 RepID=A0A069RPZ4_PEPLI|nr:nucleotidase [Peptoclostridium litorale]KDR96252.1 putative nucleotidase [Peptoclostridium litorale DSM 5388]SIO14516.1 hypothetical protein SAMN02745945_01983 [Peptoclostridium litorale DSM 5388]
MKINLCIDIDGTVTEPYYWLERANSHFGCDIKPCDVTSYEIHKVIGVSDKEYVEFYNQCCHELHMESEIREHSKDIISRLSSFCSVNYVTARQKSLELTTENWLKKHDIMLGSLHLLGSHYKVEKARELDCDIFIEDRYENAVEISNAGFDVLLINCEYNKGPLPENAKRVYDWHQIEIEINRYAQKIKSKKQEIA